MVHGFESHRFLQSSKWVYANTGFNSRYHVVLTGIKPVLTSFFITHG